jgi:hypothetical protein
MDDSNADNKTKHEDSDEKRDVVAPIPKRRKPVDIAIQAVTVLGVILGIGVAAVSVFDWKHKGTLILWLSYSAIVVVLLAFALFLQKRIWESAEAAKARQAKAAAMTESPAKSKVTIEDSKSLNPKKPFETRFILTNRSPMSIRDVNYASWAMAEGFKTLLVGLDTTMIDDLPCDASHSLYCDFSKVPTSILRQFERAEMIKLEIGVNYKYGSSDETVIFNFLAKRDAKRNYVWLPAGKDEGAQPESLDDRPYLGVFHIGLDEPIKAGQPNVAVAVHFINFGKTVARNATTLHAVWCSPKEPNATDRALKPIPGSTPVKADVMPGEIRHIELKFTANDSTLRRIEQGIEKLCVFGFFEYDDILNAHHRTEFSFVYDPRNADFEVCSEGNSMT